MPRHRLTAPLLAAACGLLLAPPTHADDAPPAPWAPSSTDTDASVAAWANQQLAPPAAAPSGATQASPFATPPAVNRYGAAPQANPIRSAEPTGPLPTGNPLRSEPEPVIRVGATAPVTDNPAAREAFATTPQSPEAFDAPPLSPAPARIAVGATPLPVTPDASSEPITIAPEAFDPAAPAAEPTPRVASAATPPEPAPFTNFAPEPAAPLAPRVADGVGQPGPERLEGPQEASLVVEKRAPREARIGQPCRFAIRVRNTGSAPAENVVLTDQTPAGARLLSTRPSADHGEGRLVWRLGTLAPGAERTVEVEIEPVREGPLGSVATVTMGASASAATTCTRPQIAVRMAAPERVLLGAEQTIAIELHNPGTGAATGVMLVEDVPPQLRHAAGPALEYEVGTLEPGATRRIELHMTAAQAGHVVNTVAAIADGDLRAERTVEFDVVAPSLAVSIDGPSRRYLERPASYTIGVGNPGTAPAKDVRLVTHLPRGMDFVRANNLGEYDETTHSVYWSLAELPEGERGEVEVVAMPTVPGDHELRVESEARDGLEAQQAHQVRVEGVASLAFEVRDLADPIEVGAETVYEVRVLNEGTQAANGVRVVVEAPAGLRIVAAQGATQNRLSAGRAEFAPLARLEPGEKTAYQVRVAGAEAGDQRVTVLVSSDELTRPIRREESTRVFGDD